MTTTAAPTRTIRHSDPASTMPFSGPLRSRASLRSIDLTGPAGRLEAILNEGAADAPFTALVCHPHPQLGGTMHNKVVYHAMKALNDPAWGLGWPVLRFNFRGAGLSQGIHDGEDEVHDVMAGVNWLEEKFQKPVVLVGFSFGAAMAVATCCAPGKARSDVRPGVQSLVALGLPTHVDAGVPSDQTPSMGWLSRDYFYPLLADCTLPKLFLSGDRDSCAPADSLAQVVASAAEPKRLQILAGADHFFTGQLESMQSALAGWMKEQQQ